MRIVFIGTVDGSRHCLKEVLKNNGNVVAVFTLDKKFADFNSDYVDLSDICFENRISIYRIKNINDPENVKIIKRLQPDIIFIFGWSQLISKDILSIPKAGSIGLHPSLLPQNRGRHPIIWALIDGLHESGLTFFYLDETADSGDILWQKKFAIDFVDDAKSVYEKVKGLASEAIHEFMPKLERGNAPRIPQDHNIATYRRKRTEIDGEIQWSATTIRIYNLIRALSHPYVGAHTYVRGKKMIIWRSRIPPHPIPTDAYNILPGTIIASNGEEYEIRTGDGYITISEYEITGNKCMLYNGYRLGIL